MGMINNILILDLNPCDVLVKCDSEASAAAVARFLSETASDRIEARVMPEHHQPPSEPDLGDIS